MSIIWPITILALLFAHALTFHLMKRRIDDLQAALVAKRVLMGDAARPIGNGRYDLAAGDLLKLVITQQIGNQLFSTDVLIDMHTSASMTVTY